MWFPILIHLQPNLSEDDPFTVQLTLEGDDDTKLQLLTNTVDGDNSADPLTTPKMYLSDVSGNDITYEFNIDFDATVDTTWADVDTINLMSLIYEIDPVNNTTEGTFLIDADIFYEVDESDADDDFLEEYPIRLTRSRGLEKQIIYLQSNLLTIIYQSILPKQTILHMLPLIMMCIAGHCQESLPV